jgi:hypothetical protein
MAMGKHSYSLLTIQIFIIEGLMIVVGSFVLYIFISNFPENAKFLSEEERPYVSGRIHHDIGRTPSNKLSVKVVLRILQNWRIWLLYYPQVLRS